MARQYFQDGPFLDPPVASGTPLVSTSIEPLWVALTYTPIYPNDAKAGKIYCVRAGGIMSTGASGTLIITPLLTATALGVSQTVTVPINMTAVPWFLEFDLVWRTIGGAGASSTCIGTGYFATAPFTSAPAAGIACVIPFGGTLATVDATIIEAIGISKTLSVAGSMTLQYVYCFSRN